METLDFLNALHHGGNWSYLWTSEGLRSAWYEPDKPFTLYQSNFDVALAGARNIYFPVYPCREIPSRNSKGEVVSSMHVRGQIEHVQFGRALFAEFDAKDYGSLGRTAGHIRSLSFKPSVIVFSGGGYHCYWLFNEPQDDIRLLQDTQARWVSWVGGDTGAKDIARVLRLPGTTNYKDKYKPNYPVVTIITNESSLDRRYEFKALSDSLPPEIVPDIPRLTLLHTHGDRPEYVAQALQQEYDRVARAAKGQRNNELNRAAYNLGQLVTAPWARLSEEEIVTTLTTAAHSCGLHLDRDCGEEGIAKSIASGISAGMRSPRREPPRRGDHFSREKGRESLQRAIVARRRERVQS